jgi:hypothetical protein
MTICGDGLDPVRLRPAVIDALATWRKAVEDGTVRLLFVAPPGEIRSRLDLVERADGYDELFLRDLVDRIAQVGTPGTVVSLARTDARPRRRDRTLCRELNARLAPSPVCLVDFLTVGTASAWSVPRRRRY